MCIAPNPRVCNVAPDRTTNFVLKWMDYVWMDFHENEQMLRMVEEVCAVLGWWRRYVLCFFMIAVLLLVTAW